ncbi:MAG TPA: histidine kinase [Mycobacteriales bacterium]|nr:histidine kinase [Mycobacteriales bacterium]
MDAPDSRSDRAWPERVLWWARAAGLVGLAVATSFYRPRVGLSGTGLASLALVIATTASGLALRSVAVRDLPLRPQVAILLAFTGCAAVYSWTSPASPGVVFTFMGIAYIATLLPVRVAVITTVGIVLVNGAGLLYQSSQTLAALLVPIAATSVLGGITRRSYADRVADAELAVAQAERARVAEHRSGALAERSRIAREIHDVLAHSLAALSMQLEAADAVLAAGDVERGRQAVARARGLAKEGMLETRRAVSALRTGLAPLPEALADLAGDSDQPVAVEISGTPRDLDAQAQLALYRAVQESLANALKHAPGAPVRLGLDYAPDRVELTVRNGAPPGRTRPMSDAGSGLGLVGMRERIASLDGVVEAGPDGEGWRVHVKMPA